jgi:type IV pilus assembly protein PilP
MRPLLAIFTIVFTASAARAQQSPAKAPPPAQPAQEKAAPAPAADAAASASQPPQAEAFTYNPDGRRDPFTSLVGTGMPTDNRSGGRRTDGTGSLSVNEISVRGILQSRGALVAMVQAPDNKTYIVHQGDKFLDGSIKSITPQGLVVIQEVNDPLSLVKQREVTKLLRSLEGGK